MAYLEPDKPWTELPKATRSLLDRHSRAYLADGGFPEAQAASVRDRGNLLRSYIDVAVLRDVIERHRISNPVALRWLQRQLLAASAERPGALPLLLTFNAMPPREPIPAPLQWQPAVAWLLGDPPAGAPR